jgi:hypothetical protein
VVSGLGQPSGDGLGFWEGKVCGEDGAYKGSVGVDEGLGFNPIRRRVQDDHARVPPCSSRFLRKG